MDALVHRARCITSTRRQNKVQCELSQMRLRPHRLCYTKYWSLAVGTRMEGPFFLGPRFQVGAENPLFFLFIIKFSWYTRGGRIEGIRTTLK